MKLGLKMSMQNKQHRKPTMQLEEINQKMLATEMILKKY